MPSTEATGKRVEQLLVEGRVGTAIDLLHRCYAADVKRFVGSLRPAASVRDVCQETWLAALAALPRYRSLLSPRAWLFCIARNKVMDAGRRQRRERLVAGLDEAEILLRSLGPPRPSTPLSRLMRQRRAAVLQGVLKGWTASDRELIELRFVLGIKPMAIVDMLYMSQTANTVAQRIVRLAARLRAELAEHDEFATT